MPVQRVDGKTEAGQGGSGRVARRVEEDNDENQVMYKYEIIIKIIIGYW